jgi:succinoglycan biosynthesis transport protein ExoP
VNAFSEQHVAEAPRPTSILGFLRRRFLAILIPLIIVPGVALALSLNQEKEYKASTSLLFRDSGIGSSVLASEDPQIEAATNLRLLQAGAVDNRVDADLGEPFTGQVDVVAEANSNLATITITDSDPQRAARVANLYAKEFVVLRRRVEHRQVAREQASVSRALAKLPPEEQSGPQAAALQKRLDSLAVAAEAPSGASQVDPATPPSSASSPQPRRNTLIGLLIGAALGIAFAIWREQRDRRVRDPHQIEALFDSPIIGRIPKSRALSKLSPGTAPLPQLEAESFRTLRANLQHLLQEQKLSSALVTSANAGDGKTTVAWNLAHAEAVSGARVLFVEADMRQPILARSLGTDGTSGLSQLLSGDGGLQDLVNPISFSENGGPSAATVDVLFAGSQPPNPAELLGSKRMQAVLESIAEPDGYDMVIVDTPPASIVSDALPMLDLVGGVVVVGRIGSSTIDSITELRNQLEQLDARTLGVVVNSDEINRSANRYYGAVPSSS